VPTHIPVSILEGKKKTLEMQGQCIVSGMCTDVLSLNYKGQHIINAKIIDMDILGIDNGGGIESKELECHSPSATHVYILIIATNSRQILNIDQPKVTK
jgi:hypothetical protein